MPGWRAQCGAGLTPEHDVRHTILAAALVACAFTGAASAAELTLFENDNFNGRSFVVRDAVNNLGNTGFNDRASSAIVRDGTWQLCDDANYRGRCISLRPGRYSSLGQMGMNDRISSARVTGGGGGGGGGPGNDNGTNTRGAPPEVTVACAQAGDRMWGFPAGTTLPFDSIRVGNGMWDVRITGNTKSGTCRVSDSGSVQNVIDNSPR